jgi:DNA-binding MarR family transcriptional regulator
MPLTIFTVYDSRVNDSPQTQTLTERVTRRVDVGGQHTGVDDPPADAANGLLQLSGLVQGLYARISQRHDLTPVQARLLCMLADGPMGMAELARCFGVEKAALTGLVDRVERRGLARRAAVPGDRRALQVRLTDAGQRVGTAFHGEVNAALSQLVATLPPDDQEKFRTATATIIAACRTHPRQHPR